MKDECAMNDVHDNYAMFGFCLDLMMSLCVLGEEEGPIGWVTWRHSECLEAPGGNKLKAVKSCSKMQNNVNSWTHSCKVFTICITTASHFGQIHTCNNDALQVFLDSRQQLKTKVLL